MATIVGARSNRRKGLCLHNNRQADFFFSPCACCHNFSDVVIDPVETDNQGEESSVKVNEERPVSTEEGSNASGLNGKAAVNEGKSVVQKPQNAVNTQD